MKANISVPQQKYDLDTSVAVILSKVSRMESDVDKINHKLESNYVTQDEFKPIKDLVYGAVGVILLAVIGGLIALILK